MIMKTKLTQKIRWSENTAARIGSTVVSSTFLLIVIMKEPRTPARPDLHYQCVSVSLNDQIVSDSFKFHFKCSNDFILFSITFVLDWLGNRDIRQVVYGWRRFH